VGAPGPGMAAIFALFLLFIALNASYDAINAVTMQRFDEWGIVSILARIAVFMGIIAAFRPDDGQAPVRRAVADLLAICIVILGILGIVTAAIMLTLGDLGRATRPVALAGDVAMYVASLWMLVAFARAGRRLWRVRSRLAESRFVIAVLAAMFFVPPQPIVYGSQTTWSNYDVWHFGRRAFAIFSAPDNSQPDRVNPFLADVESTIYRQRALVSAALDTVRPATGDQPQLFFLAAAPSASEDVFRKEVIGARALFDTEFGTRGHSAVLVNSPETVATVPLANISNLELALAGFGRVMDADRDVLVLFITTHGNKGLLSVDLAKYPFNQITPEGLAGALDRSGIRNRVLIISACHAGSFIPALAGPNTMIMTAADADSPSFGCSNQAEWTYFGDALFNHGFKASHSFAQAFGVAKQQIETWEKARKLAPSDPQIVVGSAIVPILDAIEQAQLRRQSARLD